MKLSFALEKPINGKYTIITDIVHGVNQCKIIVPGQMALIISLPQFKFPVSVSNDVGKNLYIEFREINSKDLYEY